MVRIHHDPPSSQSLSLLSVQFEKKVLKDHGLSHDLFVKEMPLRSAFGRRSPRFSDLDLSRPKLRLAGLCTWHFVLFLTKGTSPVRAFRLLWQEGPSAIPFAHRRAALRSQPANGPWRRPTGLRVARRALNFRRRLISEHVRTCQQRWGIKKPRCDGRCRCQCSGLDDGTSLGGGADAV